MYYVVAVALILSGIGINVVVNRRRFYRRNAFGREQFRSYGGSVATRWMERLAKLVALALILLGLGAAFTGHSYNRSKEVAKKSHK